MRVHFADRTESFQFTVGQIVLDCECRSHRKTVKRSWMLAVVGLLAAFAAVAPAQAEIKIGVVNFNRLMQESPQAQGVQEAMRSEFAPRAAGAAGAAGGAQGASEEQAAEGRRHHERRPARQGREGTARRRARLPAEGRPISRKTSTRARTRNCRKLQTRAGRGGAEPTPRRRSSTWCWREGVIYATSALDITGGVLAALQSRAGRAAPAAPAPRHASRPGAAPSRDRFRRRLTVSLTLGELAVRFGCELRGDPDCAWSTRRDAGTAGPGELGFLANPHYRPQLRATRAAAVVLDARRRGAVPGRRAGARESLRHLRAHRGAAASRSRPWRPGVHAARRRRSDRAGRRRAPASARCAVIGAGARDRRARAASGRAACIGADVRRRRRLRAAWRA